MEPADNQKTYAICKLEATPEWLTPESVSYVVSCLEFCENPEMLADLRYIFPREVLTEASRYIIGPQRGCIQQWLDELNGLNDKANTA